MSSIRQVIAFLGVVGVGSSVLTAAEARGYGHQWRPAAPIGSLQAGSFQRVANLPNFRPSGAHPARRIDRSGRRGHGRQLMPSRRFAYPRPGSIAQFNRPAVQPMAFPHSVTMPRAMVPQWAQPFEHMFRAWQQQTAMHPQQFAWQQARQPWQAPVPAPRLSHAQPRRPRSHVGLGAPRVAGMRPHGRSPAAYGGWRPATGAVRQRGVMAYAAPVPANAMVRHRAPRFAQSSWRPASAGPAIAWRGASMFRPASYGAPAVKPQSVRMAAQIDGVVSHNVDGLPGWATTIRDDNASHLSCGWCTGS